jgi:hypothetical protein
VIGLLALAAVVVVPCERMPEPQSTQCALARQQFICWTTESRNIRDDDPALLLFWERDEGESIDNAKVDLADERVNGCDAKPAGD